MRNILAMLALLLPGLSLAQYLPGVKVATLNGTTVSYVAPAATTSVMQCTNGTLSCWPPNNVASAVLGTLPQTGYVFAIVPPAASAQWTLISAITAAVTPTCPTTPVAPVCPVVPAPTPVVTPAAYTVQWSCAAGSAAPTITSTPIPGGIAFVITGSCQPAAP